MGARFVFGTRCSLYVIQMHQRPVIARGPHNRNASESTTMLSATTEPLSAKQATAWLKKQERQNVGCPT
jgi:hypothetical protein